MFNVDNFLEKIHWPILTNKSFKKLNFCLYLADFFTQNDYVILYN